MDPAPVRIGEAFQLEECIPPNWPFRTPERPCPRVELWPENELAAQIVFASLPEHTRPLLPEYIAALTADLDPTYSQQSIVRAVRALQGDAVAAWMRKQFEPDKGDKK